MEVDAEADVAADVEVAVVAAAASVAAAFDAAAAALAVRDRATAATRVSYRPLCAFVERVAERWKGCCRLLRRRDRG